jgi:hypothetical protein
VSHCPRVSTWAVLAFVVLTPSSLCLHQLTRVPWCGLVPATSPPPRLVPTVFPMFSAILVACVSRVPLASVSLTSSRLLCCLVTISLWIFSLCSPPLLHFSLCSFLPLSVFLTYLSLSFICPTTLLFSRLPRSVSLWLLSLFALSLGSLSLFLTPPFSRSSILYGFFMTLFLINYIS